MKKLLLLMFLLVSPLMGQDREVEPYFQYVYEKYIIMANVGIQNSVELDPFQIYPSITFNLDVLYRFLPAKIFAYAGLNFTLPFRNLQANISKDWYGGLSIGLGWYVFDNRDKDGYGWSMVMALAGVAYMLNSKHYGGGIRLISRFNYSFRENMAFNLGIDLDYVAVEYPWIGISGQKNISIVHMINTSLTFGLTFYINDK